MTRHLNMFTLIGIGVGAAFVLSAVAMLTPGIFPDTDALANLPSFGGLRATLAVEDDPVQRLTAQTA